MGSDESTVVEKGGKPVLTRVTVAFKAFLVRIIYFINKDLYF
jgi:hypothetical protein